MDGGASILAFVSAGLKSLQVVCSVVSAVKDGPDRLLDLQSALLHLLNLLTNLEKDHSLVPQSDAAIVQQCRDDIDRVKVKIEKLCITSNDKMHGRFWKRLRLVLQEKELPYILSVVNGHVARLGAYAIAGKSATITEISTLQSQFHKETTDTMTRHHASQSTTLANLASRQVTTHDTLVQQHGHHTAILTDIASRQTAAHETLLRQQSAFSAAAERQREFHDTALRYLTEQPAATVDAVAAAVRAEVERALSAFSAMSTLTSSALRAPMHNSPSLQNDPSRAEFLASLGEIERLVEEEGSLIPSEDAEFIAESMEAILRALAKEFKSESSSTKRCPSYLGNDGGEVLKLLNYLRGQFAVSPPVHLNPSHVHSPSSSLVKLAGIEDTHTHFAFSHGEVEIMRRRATTIEIDHDHRQSEKGDEGFSHQASAGSPHPSRLHKTRTRTDLILRSPQRGWAGGVILKASVVETLRNAAGARIVLAPMVSVYRMVPDGSKVFECIKGDRLDALIHLLDNGEASLRDRDSVGASLLHHAASYSSPKICRFLLEHGADPDDLARIDGLSEETLIHYIGDATPPQSPLTCLPPIYAVADATLQCAKIITDMGGEDIGLETIYHLLNYRNSSNLLRILVRTLCSTKEDAWNLSSSEIKRCSAFAEYQTLVEGGMGVGAVDNHEPPLITLMRSLLEHSSDYQQARLGNDALGTVCYFIENGADVHVTWEGRSCSQYAYAEDDETSSYTGDVWDAALAATGYDVAQFRTEQQPHSARYWRSLHDNIGWHLGPYDQSPHYSYTSQTFKEMWKGMEDYCPYYEEAVAVGEDEIQIVGRECDRMCYDWDSASLEEPESSDSEWETEVESEEDAP